MGIYRLRGILSEWKTRRHMSGHRRRVLFRTGSNLKESKE